MEPSFPDDPELESNGGGWQPDPPWEPEPDPTPWSELESEREREREREREFGPGARFDSMPGDRPTQRHGPASHAPSPAWPSPGTAPDDGFGPAYLAATAVMIVLFSLGLLTIGQRTHGAIARAILLTGGGILLLGLALLALAAWLVRHVDRTTR